MHQQYTHVHVNAHVHVHMHAYACVCVCVCMCVNTCVHMLTCMHTYTHAYIHAYSHTRARAHTHTHTHTHIHTYTHRCSDAHNFAEGPMRDQIFNSIDIRYLRVLTCARTHARIQTHYYAYPYKHTHTHTHPNTVHCALRVWGAGFRVLQTRKRRNTVCTQLCARAWISKGKKEHFLSDFLSLPPPPLRPPSLPSPPLRNFLAHFHTRSVLSALRAWRRRTAALLSIVMILDHSTGLSTDR